MRLASLLALIVALLVPSARISAQEPGINPSFPAPKTVLELFTSQGCDTCPPADSVLASFASRPDVIALSLPVDIWDYLGWKDTLASEKNSERQKAYARSRGDGAIYTPQVVVNGMMGVNGSDAGAINAAIKETDEKLNPIRVPLRFWHERNAIIIEAGAAPPGTEPKEATIWFAVVQKVATVPSPARREQGQDADLHQHRARAPARRHLERQGDEPAARPQRRDAPGDGGVHRAPAAGQGRPHPRLRLDRALVVGR